MPHVYQMDSGNWRAVVRMPSGRRTSKTDPLKSVVDQWALDLESDYRRGSTRDPRAGLISVARWYARWRPTRRWSARHAERMEGIWERYARPQWEEWSLAAITPMAVREWLAGLTEAGVGPATVRKCRDLLAPMLADAVADGLIAANPAKLPKGTLPPMRQKAPDFYTHAEIARLLDVVDARWELMLDLDAHDGLRWAELAGVRVRVVDLRTDHIHVTHVLERDGTLREYPKSSRSYRSVPIPAHRRGELAEWVDGLHPDELVWPAPRGGGWHYQNFVRRVWRPALEAARLRDLGVHGLRHTAASWLVMAGVDLYRVRELLGHESIATTQRYAHLAPDAHDVITAAWSRMHGDAPVTGTQPE